VTQQNPRIGDYAMPATPDSRPPEVRAPSLAAPEAAAEALDHVVRVLDEYDRARDDLKAARAEADAAFKADVLADADALAAGEKAAPASKRTAPKAEQRLAEAQRAKAVAAAAGRVAARNAAAAVCDTRDEWLDAVRQIDRDTASELADLVDGIADVAGRLQQARAAAAWLENVDVDRQQLPLHDGGRARVAVDIGGGREVPVSDLVAALQRLATPPATPEPRQHEVAA
jgi:hypothetical protein